MFGAELLVAAGTSFGVRVANDVTAGATLRLVGIADRFPAAVARDEVVFTEPAVALGTLARVLLTVGVSTLGALLDVVWTVDLATRRTLEGVVCADPLRTVGALECVVGTAPAVAGRTFDQMGLTVLPVVDDAVRPV